MGEDEMATGVSFRDEIEHKARELWYLVGCHFDMFSEDEKTAFRIAERCIKWAVKPPEQVTVVHRKPAISFAPIRLGDKEQGGA